MNNICQTPDGTDITPTMIDAGLQAIQKHLELDDVTTAPWCAIDCLTSMLEAVVHDSIPIPQSVEEARGMYLMSELYLKKNDADFGKEVTQ